MSLTVLGVALAVLGLLALNAVYVAAEFALIGSRRSRLEALARTGRAGARRVLALTADLGAMDRSVADCQTGITIASLGLGMYGEHAVAELLREPLGALFAQPNLAAHGLASVVAVTGLSALHVVLGELLPKSAALLDPTRAALWTEPFLRLTRFVLAPMSLLTNGAAGMLLRLTGAPPGRAADRAHTVEEIEALIEESGEGGLIGKRQAEILVNLLAFEDLPVRKVMLPRTRVAGLPIGAGREEVMATLRDTEHTRFPVYDGDLDHVLGFVHVKDVMRALDSGAPLDLKTLLRPLPIVPATASCVRVFRLLRRRRVSMAQVVDEHGGMAGIATLEDLIEEVFGEVQDEFDAEEPLVRPVPGGALVRGALRLDEANEALGVELEAEHVDTVGGLILERLGRTARVGDEIVVRDAEDRAVRLQVETVEGLAVARVRVTLPPQGATGGSGQPG